MLLGGYSLNLHCQSIDTGWHQQRQVLVEHILSRTTTPVDSRSNHDLSLKYHSDLEQPVSELRYGVIELRFHTVGITISKVSKHITVNPRPTRKKSPKR